jgi:hypothetical protein
MGAKSPLLILTGRPYQELPSEGEMGVRHRLERSGQAAHRAMRERCQPRSGPREDQPSIPQTSALMISRLPGVRAPSSACDRGQPLPSTPAWRNPSDREGVATDQVAEPPACSEIAERSCATRRLGHPNSRRCLSDRRGREAQDAPPRVRPLRRCRFPDGR